MRIKHVLSDFYVSSAHLASVIYRLFSGRSDLPR